jgi:hypothetical protein
MWTFARYRNWMSAKKDWYIPPKTAAAESAEDLPRAKNTIAQPTKPAEQSAKKSSPSLTSPALKKDTSGRIEIEPEDLGFGKILKPGK